MKDEIKKFYGKVEIEYMGKKQEAYNLITREGFKALLNGLTYGTTEISPQYMGIGTGQTNPTIDDTGLTNEVLFALTSKEVVDGGLRARFQTLVPLTSSFDGKTIYELGLFSSNLPDRKMLSRVLLTEPVTKLQGYQINMKWDYHAAISSGSGVWYEVETFQQSTKFYTETKAGYYPYGTVIQEGIKTQFTGGSKVKKYFDLNNMEVSYPLTLNRDFTVIPIFGADTADVIPVICGTQIDAPEVLPFKDNMQVSVSARSLDSLTYDTANIKNSSLSSGTISVNKQDKYIHIK